MILKRVKVNLEKKSLKFQFLLLFIHYVVGFRIKLFYEKKNAPKLYLKIHSNPNKEIKMFITLI